jgi:hypothetical protein
VTEAELVLAVQSSPGGYEISRAVTGAVATQRRETRDKWEPDF